MLKGIQKNMIWIRTPESRYFESAYFVLRPDKQADRNQKGDMLREAERLLTAGRAKEKRVRIRPLFLFLGGGGLGILLSLTVTLLISLATQSP